MMGVAALAGAPNQAPAEGTAAVDHTIRIAPTSLEIAPGKVIKTTAYNGTVPGPTLRLQEGKPVAIKVINDSGYPKSWPETNRLFTVEQGKRYRLLLNNNSGDTHPVHLHRHNFEITKVGDMVTSGVMKDTISMPRFTTAEVDFVANDPGLTMLHCHHQDHLDEGFAGVFTYA
jgi:FtsP/CotA-like multicopper oxidase with cupredoxin domain